MNVLLLTDSDAFAGTERHMLDLAVGLAACGITATVGCPAETPLAREAAAAGLAWLEVPRGSRGFVRAVRRAVADGRFDLVHAHNGRSAMLAAVAGAGGRRAAALVTTRHFIDLARESRRGVKGGLSRVAHRWLCGRIGRVIAISDAVAEASRRRDPATADRLVRVHNGSDPRRPRVGRDEARAALDVAADARVLLTVARLEREKDVALVVEAAAKLANEEPTDASAWTWLVAGQGALANSLREAARSAGLSEARLRFLGKRDDVPELMAAADALVHPAPAEPFGLALTEAMAAGLPVVAARGGAAPEIVAEGQTGALFEPGDAAALAAAVIDVLTADGSARAALGDAGRRRFESNFTAARMAAETAAVYRRLLGVPGDPAAARVIDGGAAVSASPEGRGAVRC